jgi:hypothetical protein
MLGRLRSLSGDLRLEISRQVVTEGWPRAHKNPYPNRTINYLIHGKSALADGDFFNFF